MARPNMRPPRHSRVHRAGLRAYERISPSVAPSHEHSLVRSGSLLTNASPTGGLRINSITVAGAALDLRQ